MSAPCPRCGAQRPELGACPECGFEEHHPGVLASFRQGVATVLEHPRLLALFLVPTLVFVGVQAVDLALHGSTEVAEPGIQDAVVVFLGFWWYLVALGVATAWLETGRGGFERLGDVVGASGVAALAVVTPLALYAVLAAVQPTGGAGALALMSMLLLLLGAVVLAGRAIGVPIQAALGSEGLVDAIRQGSKRARENGGLGFVFLALILVATSGLITGIAIGLNLVQPGPWARLFAGSTAFWLVGTWAGASMVRGLASKGVAMERSFTCPRCGEEAKLEGPRARCACGLEGAYYPGPGPSRP